MRPGYHRSIRGKIVLVLVHSMWCKMIFFCVFSIQLFSFKMLLYRSDGFLLQKYGFSSINFIPEIRKKLTL